MKLYLYNSLTRKKELFSPIDQNLIKLYVCGPTVYDHPHIGNARSVVIYDILYRILIKIFGKNKVRYVRNITDIDDKIIIRAKEENITVTELTNKTTKFFHDDMDYLGCLKPNIEPKATEHLDEMINIIDKLINKGIAYISNNHVYFDITKTQDYYKLSGRSSYQSITGTRARSSEGKKNPEDFVLWKPSEQDDDPSVKYDSPYGVGRPGWHIECSAMSNKYLGETFDIHGGGIDLIFPHHTNEIAQSCSAFPGSKYAKLWLHNGFLTVNNDKMSKSLGNFTTVNYLRKKGIKGDILRLFLLSNHYRKPLDYNEKAISDMQQMISYWYRAIENLGEITEAALPSEFFDCLLDDMNISMAIKTVNDFAKEIHNSHTLAQQKKLAAKLLACTRFLGIMQDSPNKWFKDADHDEILEIQKLIDQRIAAKAQKDWETADKIRNDLKNKGITIEDKPDGKSIWKKY